MSLDQTPLSDSISAILGSAPLNDWALIDELETLASTHGNTVYDEFFYVLTRNRFGPEKAFLHWNNIISHIETVIAEPFQHQGLLPSVVHYLQKMTSILSDPRLLESSIINNIQKTSVTDGLTCLYNQTFFKSTLAKQISMVRRHHETLSIVLFDLDHFKQYNDTFGHLAGDHALKQTAAIILSELRESDIAARYGGEEFAVLLPYTTRLMALKVADRIRKAVDKAVFCHQEFTPSGSLTISGGVAQLSQETADAEALIEHADQELYRAKARRNCISPISSDRRRDFRRPVRSLVECSPHGADTYHPALSVDISRVGISIGCEWNLDIEMPVKLRFKKPYWNESAFIEATVRQSKRVGDFNVIGMEFKDGLPEIPDKLLAYAGSVR